MVVEKQLQLANFVWSVCNLLCGPYKRNEYRKVILPLIVLRRFDCLLAPTKDKVLEAFKAIKTKPETVVRSLLQKVTGRSFYNLSKMQFDKDAKHSLLNDPNNLAPNLNRHFCRYEPPRPLEAIQSDIRKLEGEIVEMLGEVAK